MNEFPYEDYVNFFSIWFGNVFFITIAFLLWLASTIYTVLASRGTKWWFRAPLVFEVSAVHYLIFGLLIAGGMFGGEAEFLYDPALLRDNLLIHGGLQGILLWPTFLLSTGGYLVVVPVVVIVLVFLLSRRGKREASGEKRGQA